MAYEPIKLYGVLINALQNKWRLIWDDTNENVDGEVSYIIYKAWHQYATLSSDTRSFEDEVTKEEMDNFIEPYMIYQVTMAVDGKEVAWSNEVEVPYNPVTDALIYTDRKHYNDIAKKIQEYTGKNKKYTPEEMALGIVDVYNAGANGGVSVDVWGKIQNYGDRTFYPYFFAYDAYPYPKLELPYPILGTALPTTSGGIYATNGGNSMFRQNNYIEEILTDITITSGSAYVFQKCMNLRKILLIIVNEQQVYTGWFENDSKLVFIRWGGTIGQSVDIGDSPLDKESFVDTITHLSTTASGKTITFNKAAINAAFGINVDDTTTWSEGSEFYNLRYSRSNWTFAYR